MNAPFILSNVKEAQEELTKLVASIEANRDLTFEEFHVSIAHAYHHLNSAWNGRNATLKEWQNCTEKNFSKWERFPKDLPLIGSERFYELPEYRTKDKTDQPPRPSRRKRQD